MARLWTDADEERWGHVEAEHAEPNEADAALLRDVVAACIVHLVAVLLYRLRLAAPSARNLSEEIEAARASRTFWDWLAEPMLDLPECGDETVATDG